MTLKYNDKKDRKELYKLAIEGNSIILICFTILAILFNKWWVIFFSILFINCVEKEDE